MGHDQEPGVAEVADGGCGPVDEATLEAILDRANAAAPGPWRVRSPDPTVLDSLAESWACASGEEVREFPGAAWIDGPAWIDCTDTGLWFDPADAAFVTHARTDVPALVTAVRRLAAENATLRSPMDDYDGPRGWVPVDGGRLDELEATEAEVEQLRVALESAADGLLVVLNAGITHGATTRRLQRLELEARVALHPQGQSDA